MPKSDRWQGSRSRRSDALALGNELFLYWKVSDDRAEVIGPFAIYPDTSLGWTTFGIKADVLAREEWKGTE